MVLMFMLFLLLFFYRVCCYERRETDVIVAHPKLHIGKLDKSTLDAMRMDGWLDETET